MSGDPIIKRLYLGFEGGSKLLKLPEMVKRACFEVKALVIESSRTVRGAEART